MVRRVNSVFVTLVVILVALAGYGQSGEVHQFLLPKAQIPPVKFVNNLADQAKPQSRSSNQSNARQTDKESKKEPQPKGSTLEPNRPPVVSLSEKEQLLGDALADISYTAFMIEPVEYSIIVQIEVASLLWEKERERANEILVKAGTRLRNLLKEKTTSSSTRLATQEAELEKSRLRQAVLRRIARLNPDFIKDLQTEGITNSDVGAAIAANAVEEIKHDPKLAVQLAVQGLSHGAIYQASTFLMHLWFEDKRLAETVALMYLEKLPMDSVSGLWLVTQLYSYLSQPAHDQYFKSLANRLRLCLKPDLSISDYRNLLAAASKGLKQATAYPDWGQEFSRSTTEIEKVLASRSIPAPVSPAAKPISMSGMLPATPGNTAGIEHSAQELEVLKNQKIKDAEYRRLAIAAAEKWDVSLAERLLSKISDEEARKQATPPVYGPLVKKALAENDWPQARNYALSVTDPLGLSLIVVNVAKAMQGAKLDKQVVNSFYDEAFSNLDRALPSLYVAKAAITLTKARFAIDPVGGFTTANLAVNVLNGADTSNFFSSKSRVTEGLDPWVNQTNLILMVDDYFDLTETLGPLFKDLSRHDFVRARELSLSISHLGLRSLAQLGIVRGIQEELKGATNAQKSKKQTRPGK